MKGAIKQACLVCLALLGAAQASGQVVGCGWVELAHWLSVWQEREGLEGWDIDLRIVRQSEMRPNIIGDVDWWIPPGKAHIRVVCAEDLKSVYGETPSQVRSEMERVVIHELMHLVLSSLYDDGSGRASAWLTSNPNDDARVEAITEALAVMLLSRRVPRGYSEAQFIRHEIDSGPWRPAADVRARVMLQLVRAMNAATEDD
jgi:hypothetical protein